MSDLSNLEQRLAALERAVAEIQLRLAGASAPGNWIEKISGSIPDHAALTEAMELARAWRQADRPPDDDPGEKP